MKVPGAVANSYGYVPFTGVSGRSYFARSYIRLAALPASGSIVLLMEYEHATTSQWCEVVVTPTGALRIDTNASTVGTGSAISAAGTIAPNTWYRVEFKLTYLTAGSDVMEVRLNGVTVATFTQDYASTVPSRIYFGQFTNAAGVDVWHDDMCLNDDQGVTSQNTWPGEGAIRKLMPTGMVQAGTGWLKPGGSAAALNTAVDNVPATGVAHSTLATNAERQVYNITSTTTGNLQLTLQSPDAAGVPAGDTITLVQPVAVTGASATTGTPTGSLRGVSNPVITESNFGQFRGAANAGNFASGWILRGGPTAYAPSMTRNVGPVIEIGKRTATTTAVLVAQAAMLVESAAPPVPSVEITVGPSAASISRVPGKDATTFSWTSTTAYDAWEVRLVASESTLRLAGTLVESGGSGAAATPAQVQILDDELVAAQGGVVEGLKRLKVFAKNANGWSDGTPASTATLPSATRQASTTLLPSVG